MTQVTSRRVGFPAKLRRRAEWPRARDVSPAGFVLFTVLAFVFLGEKVVATPRDTTTFAWSVAFISAAVAGLVINEIAARRAVRRLKEAIMQLGSMK